MRAVRGPVQEERLLFSGLAIDESNCLLEESGCYVERGRAAFQANVFISYPEMRTYETIKHSNETDPFEQVTKTYLLLKCR